MRYPASEKLEIIRIVERSHLPTKRRLAMLGIPRTTFYRWYDRYIALGEAGLEDQPSRPGRVWNRIPDAVRRQIVDLALEEPELSPRELAVRFTDRQRYFVSEAGVCRLLVAHDLVTSPAFAIIKAADEFHESEGLPATGSRARPERPARTSSGRPTSPTSRSSAGGGSTCRRSSTTTAATSSPGASAPPCAPGT
jgi:putative transposase